MNAEKLTDRLAEYTTGNLCNAHVAVQAMHSRIAPLFKGARLAGTARTVKIIAGQNAAIHRAVYLAKSGEVLVVDAGGSTYYGPFGDILARACMARGIKGLIIDGTVRDSAEITELHFPVFCTGRNPAVTAKTEAGEVNIEIRCGDVRVEPGDFVVGDADGVVVIPHRLARDVAEKARAVVAKEENILRQLEAGKTTYEIFTLSGLYDQRKK